MAKSLGKKNERTGRTLRSMVIYAADVRGLARFKEARNKGR